MSPSCDHWLQLQPPGRHYRGRVRQVRGPAAGADTALALWVMHAHSFAASPITPRLALVSPEKRCGKTTSLEVIQALVPEPLLA